jgi:hypothetical protein
MKGLISFFPAPSCLEICCYDLLFPVFFKVGFFGTGGFTDLSVPFKNLLSTLLFIYLLLVTGFYTFLTGLNGSIERFLLLSGGFE